ncbi:MAG TPA: myo-inosose-2 dehydratase [Dongiaceae bacterium]|nr:myo-inosose-2 dehydratase [Dongiaceae bacterium]
MTVRIGINPITWTNDDLPELGGDIPLDTCLAEARMAGFAGIEMGGKFPRQSRELAPIMKRHELALVSGWYDGRLLDLGLEAEWQAVNAHLTLLRDMGCGYVVYADTSRRSGGDLFAPISQRPQLTESEWSGYGRQLTQLAERMREFGVGMAFHHHMGTVVERDAEVDRLMAVTGPAVGLLFDSGHSAFAGGDPVALARRHAKRIVHVHCKDTRRPVLDQARATNGSFMQAVLDGVFTVPGDGSVDFPAILSILHEAGYDGWLVVEAEQDPNKAHPLTYAKLGFANLVRLALQAGHTVAP